MSGDPRIVVLAEEAFPNAIIVYPKESEVFVDIDTIDNDVLFYNRIDELCSMGIPCKVTTDRKSDSGYPHSHKIVTFSGIKFTPLERIAMQYLLCSDPIRERLSVYRLLAGKDPNKVTCFKYNDSDTLLRD